MEAGRTSSLTSGREKHVFALHSQGKQQQPGQFFRKEDGDSDVRAECLFTGFLLKHNIPLTAADHVGPLFCKMFPTLDIAESAGSSLVCHSVTPSTLALVRSPQTYMNVTPCLALNCSNHPSLKGTPSCLRTTASCSARFLSKNPFTGILRHRASRSHSSSADSTSGYVASWSLKRSGLISPQHLLASNTLIIHN
ncbi:hypothetical protein MRX96_009048 [Rhipicephalus microplus]